MDRLAVFFCLPVLPDPALEVFQHLHLLLEHRLTPVEGESRIQIIVDGKIPHPAAQMRPEP